MYPLLNDVAQEPETRPEATDVLSRWAVSRGFKLNKPMPGGYSRYSQGYFIRGTGNSANWSWYNRYDHACIGFRGGGPNFVRAQLRKVATILEELGADYDVELISGQYPILIVTLNDALRREAEASA